MANDTFPTLGTGALVAATGTALVTGADAATGIRDLIVYNSGASTRLLTFHIVKAGKSFGDASDILLAVAIPVLTHQVFRLRDHTDPEIELGLGDALSGFQDAGTDCTWYCLGA